MCFGVHVAFSTNENPGKPVQTRIGLVTNIHEVWMKIKTRNKIWTSIVQLDASTVLN